MGIESLNGESKPSLQALVKLEIRGSEGGIRGVAVVVCVCGDRVGIGTACKCLITRLKRLVIRGLCGCARHVHVYVLFRLGGVPRVS
jgi:hypothetical protein